MLLLIQKTMHYDVTNGNFIELKSVYLNDFSLKMYFKLHVQYSRHSYFIVSCVDRNEGLRRDGGFENWVWCINNTHLSRCRLVETCIYYKFNRIPLSVWSIQCRFTYDLTNVQNPKKY